MPRGPPRLTLPCGSRNAAENNNGAAYLFRPYTPLPTPIKKFVGAGLAPALASTHPLPVPLPLFAGEGTHRGTPHFISFPSSRLKSPLPLRGRGCPKGGRGRRAMRLFHAHQKGQLANRPYTPPPTPIKICRGRPRACPCRAPPPSPTFPFPHTPSTCYTRSRCGILRLGLESPLCLRRTKRSSTGGLSLFVRHSPLWRLKRGTAKFAGFSS